MYAYIMKVVKASLKNEYKYMNVLLYFTQTPNVITTTFALYNCRLITFYRDICILHMFILLMFIYVPYDFSCPVKHMLIDRRIVFIFLIKKF